MGVGLRRLYLQLLDAGGVFEKHIVAWLEEDLNVRDVLRRDLLPFAVSTEQDNHLGHVKAIALLEDDQRFVLRLKTDIFVLNDNPTEAQVRAIKETLLELSPVAD